MAAVTVPGLDQIGHRLGLHEVHPAVDERPQGELARLRQACAGADDGFHDLPQQQRAAVAADLDYVLAGIRRRSGKVGGDHLVQRPLQVRGADHGRERGVPRLQVMPGAQDRAGSAGGRRAADAHHPDAAPAGRRGHRDDRVVG